MQKIDVAVLSTSNISKISKVKKPKQESMAKSKLS